MSDERDSAGSEGTEDAGTEDAAGQTAVVTRPLRPTGKRTRRAAAAPVEDAEPSEADAEAAEGDDEPAAKSGKAGKTAKAGKAGKGKKSDTKRVNPFAFVWNYLKQVVAELRKVIWPNRKQMVSYTTVVLVFLAFMVALIGGVDLGLAKLVSIVFG
ncbi:preprotein translocase subunit SecE [Mycolicibacterium sp. 120266]|uniref:preprotein translocase subunit SecE n=1 Tax=Mycolicibacterium sp. 120266 TaxID=3090601 RepID=UPI00299E0CFB|nr:preprotein translocase subunit SecE [Mycolicibacterium sp. 120266]MDX1875733.1 preprotein translocase subunit SecE [Mycolicibacterium sp. 120266]